MDRHWQSDACRMCGDVGVFDLIRACIAACVHVVGSRWGGVLALGQGRGEAEGPGSVDYCKGWMWDALPV